MKTLRTLSFTLGFMLATSAFAAPAKKAYPIVSMSQGEVWLTGTDNKRAPAKTKTLLRGHALIETSTSSEIHIQWDDSRELTVLAGSEVSVPAIAWETGEAPVVILKSGSLRWSASTAKDSYNVALRSDLFEFLAPPADFVLGYDPKKAFAEVKMFQGHMQFSCMNGEESVAVNSGQKAGFQGVLEEGQVAYDILLKGRKIPRGKLTEVSDLTSEDSRPFTDAAAKLKKQKQQAVKKEAAAAQLKKSSGQICDAPPAKFNECSWTCQGNPKKEKKACLAQQAGVQCVRRRCNANGEWADESILAPEKAQVLCKSVPVVGACDY